MLGFGNHPNIHRMNRGGVGFYERFLISLITSATVISFMKSLPSITTSYSSSIMAITDKKARESHWGSLRNSVSS